MSTWFNYVAATKILLSGFWWVWDCPRCLR